MVAFLWLSLIVLTHQKNSPRIPLYTDLKEPNDAVVTDCHCPHRGALFQAQSSNHVLNHQSHKCLSSGSSVWRQYRSDSLHKWVCYGHQYTQHFRRWWLVLVLWCYKACLELRHILDDIFVYWSCHAECEICMNAACYRLKEAGHFSEYREILILPG